MKIKSVHAFAVDLSKVKKKSTTGYEHRGLQPAGPMERYPAYKAQRSLAGPHWKRVVCVAEAEDGTTGVGMTVFSGGVLPIINDHLASHVAGQSVMATERHFDVMVRASSAYGSQGLTSYGISAIDLALWDLKGKLLQRPVYELLGGPQKERIFCYATGFDLEWYLELGFKAVKLPMPYGPEDGIEGLGKAEEMVADAREKAGPSVELMLDCWMALDVEYTARLAELLKPYRLKWIEDFLLPDDLAGFAEVRRRLPWQGLATGEHWYLARPFAAAAEQRLVDIFQPDTCWVGGVSAILRICHIAEAAGINVMPHGAMNDAYGQHVVFAMPATTWGERSQGVSPRGVPLRDVVEIPGSAYIEDGCLVPSDAPGFGIEVNQEWLEQVAV